MGASGGLKAVREQLAKGAAAMAERLLVRCRHLGEGLRYGRPAGTSDRSRSRRHRAADRPAGPRPGPAPAPRGRPARPGTAPRRRRRRDRPPRSCHSVSPARRAPAPWRGEKSLPGSAQRAECTPGLPSSACTTRPESSASAGRPQAFAAACALMRALAAKLSPSSTGSGRPSAALAITSMRSGFSMAANSRTLPGLWVASTRRVALEAPRQAHGSRASAWRCRAISWRTPLSARSSMASN